MIFVLLYFVNAVITIVTEHFDLRIWMYVSKVMLMPLLAIFFYSRTKSLKPYVLIYLALFFSWWGDIFLMLPRDKADSGAKLLFICGLVSFLIAHINYIFYFLKEVKAKPKVTVIVEKPYLVFPFLLYIILFLSKLYPSLAVVGMRMPVTIYALVIITMLMTAFNRKNLVESASFHYVFWGALLFVFSDSCIAVNVFHYPFEGARAVIMSTYIVAQYLIIKGVLLNIASGNK